MFFAKELFHIIPSRRTGHSMKNDTSDQIGINIVPIFLVIVWLNGQAKARATSAISFLLKRKRIKQSASKRALKLKENEESEIRLLR